MSDGINTWAIGAILIVLFGMSLVLQYLDDRLDVIEVLLEIQNEE